MATSLEKEKLSKAGIQSAAEDGIAILCREDLVKLYEMSAENRPVGEAVEFVRSRVPREFR